MPDPSKGASAVAPPAPPRERRAAVRFGCALVTSCHPVPEGEPLGPGLVRDLSTTGMGLVVDRYVEPETVLAVELENEDAGLSYALMVLVRNARPQADGAWLLGCSLGRDLSPYELEALL